MAKVPRTSWARLITVLALSAASLALAGCSLLGGGKASAPSADATTGSDVFSIKVGDCLNDATLAGKSTSTVPIVDCAKPHDSEAYLSGKLDGGDFPGADVIKQNAEALCGPGFKSFAGAPFTTASRYNYTYYTPTTESWAAGDREIMCVIYDPTGAKVIGTLKGAEG